MLVLFHLRTNVIGCDSDEVYEFDTDMSDDALYEYGYELAKANAEMYGVAYQDDDSGCEPEEGFYATYEVLDISREEAEELYGTVLCG